MGLWVRTARQVMRSTFELLSNMENPTRLRSNLSALSSDVEASPTLITASPGGASFFWDRLPGACFWGPVHMMSQNHGHKQRSAACLLSGSWPLSIVISMLSVVYVLSVLFVLSCSRVHANVHVSSLAHASGQAQNTTLPDQDSLWPLGASALGSWGPLSMVCLSACLSVCRVRNIF